MISIQRLGKSYGGRTLFEEVSLELNEGSRYGLVGANGSGKTTFLKCLSGDEPQTDGSYTFPSRSRVGTLRQDHFLDDEQIILDLAMMGDKDVWDALQERTRIIDHAEGDPSRLADLEHTISTAGGYTLEARASSILEGLGIPVPSHRQKLSTLSGGFKLRVLLAQVLVGGPDALLLDEPTNHLDILSIRWLEKFLAGYRGCAIVISHDQRFLDNVATHILDVDYDTITQYTGNYRRFVAEKAAVRERKEGENARKEKIIADKMAFVVRFGAKATKAKQAQSRLKQIEKIEVEELAQSSRRAPYFRFTPERPSGREVLDVKGISKAYGDKQVLTDVSITVRRGEKLAVIGPNGLGKSTLLKIIMGRLDPDVGAVRFGHETKVGYFAQDHGELLPDGPIKPLDFIWNECPTEPTTYVRGQLGRMLFSGDDIDKPIRALSGGEAARLIFCKIMVQKPNVLVLDEPTNHLDLESIDALIEGLKEFDGTVIFVSHDRAFVSALATRVLEVRKEGPRDFPGTYTEYLERCGDDHLDANAVIAVSKAAKTDKSDKSDKSEKTGDKPGDKVDTKNGADAEGLSWEEQKKRRNRKNSLPARRDKLLVEIETCEARKKEIDALFAAPGFFERTLKGQVLALQEEDKKLASDVEAKIKEWEEIEAELAPEGG